MVLFDVLQEFAMSAFQPGVNRGLIVVLHMSFLALFTVLTFLNFLLSFSNIHIWLLTASNVILYCLIVWFIKEAYGEKAEESKSKGTQKPARKTKKNHIITH